MSKSKYIVTPKGISKPSMTSTDVMGKSEVCKLLNQLEKEKSELKDLVFKAWMSQTERFNQDSEQDIPTQWKNSYIHAELVRITEE